MIIRCMIRQPLARPQYRSIDIKNGRLSQPTYQSSRNTSTATHVHKSISPIQSKYKDPSIYNPQIIPPVNRVADIPSRFIQASTVPSHIKHPDVLVTLYSFPTFEPLELVRYPATHLHLPLRRDILHRAVIYEGDKTRTDTVHTISRREHPGSGRKLGPQKGQGRARVGDSSSPIRTTGVKVFGPKLRDFATGLPRKMYDLAWRTALSWRYRKGELLVVDKLASEHTRAMDKIQISKLVEAFNGTSLGSATNPRKDEISKEKPLRTMWVLKAGGDKKEPFGAALQEWYPKDVVKNVDDVDVKNLLEGKRIVIEKGALDEILRTRQRDIRRPVDIVQNKEIADAGAAAMAQAVAETNAIQEELQRTVEAEAQQLQEDLAKVTQSNVIPELER